MHQKLACCQMSTLAVQEWVYQASGAEIEPEQHMSATMLLHNKSYTKMSTVAKILQPSFYISEVLSRASAA